LRFLVNWVRQSGVLIHFPQLAPSRSPRTHLRQCTVSPPITAALAKWPRKRPLVEGPEQRRYHVLEQFCTPNTWQSLWSFADVGTGTLVPIDWRGDESAGIYRFPVPVFSSIFGHEICASEPSLIIEHTNFTEPTYHTWMSASLSLLSASFVLQFRRIDEPLLVTVFMTRRPRSMTPFFYYITACPPRSPSFYLLSSPPLICASYPTHSPSIPYCLHGLLSLSKTCQILLLSVRSIGSKDPHPSTKTQKDAQGWYQ
jgi:hypothetical protein